MCLYLFGGIWSIISETQFPMNVISLHGLQHKPVEHYGPVSPCVISDVGILKALLTFLRIRDNINAPHSSN